MLEYYKKTTLKNNSDEKFLLFCEEKLSSWSSISAFQYFYTMYTMYTLTLALHFLLFQNLWLQMVSACQWGLFFSASVVLLYFSCQAGFKWSRSCRGEAVKGCFSSWYTGTLMTDFFQAFSAVKQERITGQWYKSVLIFVSQITNFFIAIKTSFILILCV